MDRVGIHEKDSLEYAKAFIDGVVSAGDHPIPQNPCVWNPDQDNPELDYCVVFGGQGQDRHIMDYYRARQVPVFFVELGHVNRPGMGGKFEAGPEHYFQFGIERLCWMPDWECPSDRREALGIEYPEMKSDAEGYVLLLGQKPGDAQHPITDMVHWRTVMMRRIEQYTDRQIKWRKHPKDYNPLDHSCDDESLEEAFEGAFCVVTHNSNAGIKAILAGIPVVCSRACFYAELCYPLHRIEDRGRPTQEAFEDFFNRLAYAQWTYEEFRTGEPWRFLKDAHSNGLGSHSDIQTATVFEGVY